MKSNHLWMNLETGELLSYDEMVEQAREWYDLDDDTNVIGDYCEYYEETPDLVPADWEEWKAGDDEPADIDDDCGFDPYEGCYTWDC